MTARTDIGAELEVELMGRGSLPGTEYIPPTRKRKWLWRARYSAPNIELGSSNLTLNHDDQYRRTVLIVDAPWGVTFTLELYPPDVGGHTWDGGQPPAQIDLEDYPMGVFQAAQLTTETVLGAACFTGRLPGSLPVVDSGNDLAGEIMFLRGEQESELEAWPGRVQTG